MSTPLHVLILEDNPDDAVLMIRELKRAGFTPTWQRVDTMTAYLTHLAGNVELILADYTLPQFNALRALELMQQQNLDIPFIVVTGSISEEVAVACMKQGAADYLLKDRLRRLGSAVVRALHEHQLRLRQQCTEVALRHSEIRFRAIAEAVPVPVVISRLSDGTILYANTHFVTTFGLDCDAVRGQKMIDFPGQADSRGRLAARRRDPQIPAHWEACLHRPDGKPFWAMVTFQELIFDGEPALLECFYDITARKTAEEALQQAHLQTAQILTALPSMLIGLDTAFRITWWNTAAETAFGLSAAEVLGRHVADCPIPWDRAAMLNGLQQCWNDRQRIRLNAIHFQQRNRQKGFLGVSLTLMEDSEGAVNGILLLAQDITEHRLLESQLAQAQKLEAIGQLAAGVAHEINTPIQYISDNIHFLRQALRGIDQIWGDYATLFHAAETGAVSESVLEQLSRPLAERDDAYFLQEIPVALHQSLDGLSRVTAIVRAMKDFSYPGRDEKIAIDLNRSIESTITVTRHEWKYVANMMTDFDPDLPPVPCLPGEFNQAILNLLINAAQAISTLAEDGIKAAGTITVSTRRQGDWVEVCVADTGPGIPVAVRSKVFDPFFTTKDVGMGTGQGLTIVHDVVVKKHGGSIRFETEEDCGTVFVIRLPLVSDTTLPGGE